MKNAFTLAEVLITLGIIGVVAAMTLPTLINKFQEKQTVTAVKKAYSEFSQAFMMMHNEYPDLSTLIDENKTNGENSEILFQELTKYMKTIKRCDTDKICFGNDYKNLVGKNIGNWDNYNNVVTGILSDGTTFWILNGWDNNFTPPRFAAQFGIDINGRSKPNQLGVDFFWFNVREDGRVMTYSQVRTPGEYKNCDIEGNSSSFNGYGCTEWILTSENMDYLKHRITIGAPD